MRRINMNNAVRPNFYNNVKSFYMIFNHDINFLNLDFNKKYYGIKDGNITEFYTKSIYWYKSTLYYELVFPNGSIANFKYNDSIFYTISESLDSMKKYLSSEDKSYLYRNYESFINYLFQYIDNDNLSWGVIYCPETNNIITYDMVRLNNKGEFEKVNTKFKSFFFDNSGLHYEVEDNEYETLYKSKEEYLSNIIVDNFQEEENADAIVSNTYNHKPSLIKEINDLYTNNKERFMQVVNLLAEKDIKSLEVYSFKLPFEDIESMSDYLDEIATDDDLVTITNFF